MFKREDIATHEQVVSAFSDGIAAEILTPREEQIVRMRFGIDTPQTTLKGVGAVFYITPERVRQIELKALRRLRGLTPPSNARKAFAP